MRTASDRSGSDTSGSGKSGERNGRRGSASGKPRAEPPAAVAVRGRVGVVDIGSNTVRLVVYDVPTRLPVPIFNEKAQCALGFGIGSSGRLNPAGVGLALRTLRRFVALAEAMGVGRLELVATAAVRDASDGPSFIEAAEKACGRPVHVLSGAEEARLAAVGLTNGIAGADGVLGDLGGGSLDLVNLSLGKTEGFATLPLGHLRLAEESGGDRKLVRSILDRELAKVPWLADINGRVIYCAGGSWRALARVFIDQTHHPLHVVDNYVIGFFDALRLCDLVASLSQSTLERLPGVDSPRLESLPYAAAALAALLQKGGPREVMFSAYGMREGQMLELLPPQLRQQDPLISACESQAERTGRFTLHGQEILDWMTPLFPDETEAERRLRYAACLLSDIGWSEHPDYRAIHAFHRVLRIPYPGLLHSDRAMLALSVLIRYGGNEEDRFVAPVRALLSERSLDRARVTGLALRLSHSLSGGAAGLLPRAKLKIDKTALTLDLRRDEVFRSEAVERRFGRLAKALNLKANVLG
jgi:exopolyphosphatase/guanosine-5'-triphosphate,3'-diphosphate pyrophosphatase